jgi:hypothetical protein
MTLEPNEGTPNGSDSYAIESPGKMAATKPLFIVLLGIIVFYGQAHAQSPGCTVMEVGGEAQAVFTQGSPTVVDGGALDNALTALARQDNATALVRVPLPRPRDRLRDDKDYAPNISARERAFASGQNLADYCNLKIKADKRK